MATVDRTPVEDKRSAFDQARAVRLGAQAALAAAKSAAAALARTRTVSDPELQAAIAAVATEQAAVEGARRTENAARLATTSAIASWLSPDPSADVARLESRYPVVLLPIRLETRFIPESSELLVRIYPDEISADAHEPELSSTERAGGQAYWVAASGAETLAAWQTLLLTYTSQRAAWIVSVTDPSARSSPAAFDKPSGWSRAVEARLLPDRYIAIATRGGTTKEVVGGPIVEPLALSVGPDSLQSDQGPIGPDGNLTLDDAVKWTVDFDTAVSAGMGLRLPLDADDLRLGFDRVIVVGVKTSMAAREGAARLGALLDAHHYTSGLSFVKQGSPTSNTIGTPAAYPPADENGAHSFAIERGAPLDAAPSSAGQMLTLALGLPRGLFEHVEGAELSEIDSARQMNRVLYSATLGYFLDQMMAPVVGADAVDEVRAYFSQWVLPRGLSSAFRVGRVPYGVLPATSLKLWQDDADATPVAKRMSGLLQKIVPIWGAFSTLAPHVGRSADPDQDLLDVLSMDASARQVRIRRVLGEGTWLNLGRLFNWTTGAWESYHQTVGGAALTAAGIASTPSPRIVGMNFSDVSSAYSGPLVDTLPVSETDPLGSRDYIAWARTATLSDLQAEKLPPGLPADVTQVLLYRFLRHATLSEYHWSTGKLIAEYAVERGAAWREPELVGIVPGTEAVATPWQRFQTKVTLPNVGVTDVASFLERGDDVALRSLTGVGDYRDALAALSPLPTAELERVFTESLDAVSHRVDAWVTSLANKRLSEMNNRLEKTPGCFVGAYGWVENLRPGSATFVTLPDGRSLRTTPGGYIHAPSMTHATTAAVLRNAYMTHLAPADSPYAIDLSSVQVRMGRFVLDSVRNGQPVGAVFGYLMERAFHERHAESLIDPVRQAAPLVADKIEESDEPVETIAARNVVDGLALRLKWKAGQLFDVPGGIPGTIAHRDVLEDELRRLDRHVDAVADLMLAESVHQIVRGSTMASGAGLDALAQGTRPPDPDVGKATTGGTTFTHRLAVVLGPTPAALGDGWPKAPTARAACEPRLDAWFGSLLGDPRNAVCRVQYRTGSGAMQVVKVAFDALALRPTDTLALAKAVLANPAASELDRRVLYAAFGEAAPADAAPDASFQVVYEADPAWDRSTTRSIPELLDVANAVARSVGSMRGLTPVDVTHPSNASSAGGATNPAEAMTRAQAAVASLAQAETELAAAIALVPSGATPTPAQTAEVRRCMRSASEFGIGAAFPSFVTGAQEGGVSPLPLFTQAASVLADVDARLAAASKTTDPVAISRAVFGRDYQLLVGFAFSPSSPEGGELVQALANGPLMLGGDAHAVDRFLTQVTRVREALGRWRWMRILSEASGAAPPVWSVAQLPSQAGASWMALPPNANEDRASGTISLVLHAPAGAIDATQPLYGLFLDDWVETIPNAREHTGIAFRHEDTAGEAPQTLLVAVPPTGAETWDFAALVSIISETLDLAKVRAVDLELVDPLAHLIPTIFLASNANAETISTALDVKRDAILQSTGAS